MSTNDASRAAPPDIRGSDCGHPAIRGSRWWWWVVAAFALQFAAWTAWLVVAAHQKIQDVPLATPGAGAN